MLPRELYYYCLFHLIFPTSQCIHHMKFTPLPMLERRQGAHTTPLIFKNQCPGDIWPAIGTQFGVGPSTQGFKLAPGEERALAVSQDWQGRAWGRANCSFNAAGTGPSSGGVGRACESCDCNGQLDCKVGGDNPCTLAEFTLHAGDKQTYYDISLVDGYNLPMAIVVEPHGDSHLEDIPPNLTNPSCVGTIHLLAPQDFNPYPTPDAEFLNTNSSYKLPLDVKVNDEQVDTWCPWDLMVNQPKAPQDGHYDYPDGKVQRPAFNPCLSACTKYQKPEDCCQGEYNSPSKCPVGEYSKSAKAVCPDAYSYAFDDQTSTFIIPSGAGFIIIFCPGGRSTNIL
ncbi:Osmotin, thaumatin-like protein, partial [Tothia fuscella]